MRGGAWPQPDPRLVLKSTQEVPLEDFSALDRPYQAGLDLPSTFIQALEAGLGQGGGASCGATDAAAVFRPLCQAGIDSPESTSLKWSADGELTAQDLHHVLARLLACDQEAIGMIDGEPSR
jgi:hypothetical protein